MQSDLLKRLNSNQPFSIFSKFFSTGFITPAAFASVALVPFHNANSYSLPNPAAKQLLNVFGDQHV
jgi:hypothetical protein